MEVVVRFGGGKVKPEEFELNGRWYRVKQITLVWQKQDGQRKYMCFSVDTGGMLAELRMDLQNFQFSIFNFQPSGIGA